MTKCLKQVDSEHYISGLSIRWPEIGSIEPWSPEVTSKIDVRKRSDHLENEETRPKERTKDDFWHRASGWLTASLVVGSLFVPALQVLLLFLAIGCHVMVGRKSISYLSGTFAGIALLMVIATAYGSNAFFIVLQILGVALYFINGLISFFMDSGIVPDGFLVKPTSMHFWAFAPTAYASWNLIMLLRENSMNSVRSGGGWEPRIRSAELKKQLLESESLSLIHISEPTRPY